MAKKVAIIGASIGGLVAAAELKLKGFNVTLIERGKSVGGLYGNVDTPFGKQEMGMHVLYLTEPHHDHLCSIFGEDVFQVWHGYKVDVGAAFNFGRTYFNSIYPDIRGLPEHRRMVDQIIENSALQHAPTNALQAVKARFGDLAGENVYSPILKKLWGVDPEFLSADAIHCFFDLRRVVACDKAEADGYKADLRLDHVIANPDQTKPYGTVFEGRMAARFKKTCGDLSKKVLNWMETQDIEIFFESSVTIQENKLVFDGIDVADNFDATIVATPLAGLIPDAYDTLDSIELSIYYFALSEKITEHFPAYYMLCHDPSTLSSRIVNYDAYAFDNEVEGPAVISVEVAHAIGKAPSAEVLVQELARMLPFASVTNSYKLPNTLRVPVPSVRNAAFLDQHSTALTSQASIHPVFLSGMRTDKGIFFSHHTIGLAYESALACAAKLA